MKTKILKPTKRVWVTRDGQQIPVHEIEDSHLVNLVKLLISQGRLKQERELEGVYFSSAVVGGEMAQYYLERDTRFLECENLDEFLKRKIPTWEALKLEVRKRELKQAIDALSSIRCVR